MTDPSPDLVFPGRKRYGAHEVTEGDEVVARITVSWTGHRFTATDAGGTPLCEARTSWWRLPPTWHASGPDGRPLLSARMRGVMRTTAHVHLERGGRFVVQGRAWTRDFRATDEHGVRVLTAAPRTSALSLRQHDYAVQQVPGTFRLPEVVALVQIWRMTMEEELDAAAGGAVLGGVAVI